MFTWKKIYERNNWLENMNIINMARYVHHISFWQRKDVMYRRRADPFLCFLLCPFVYGTVQKLLSGFLPGKVRAGLNSYI